MAAVETIGFLIWVIEPYRSLAGFALLGEIPDLIDPAGKVLGGPVCDIVRRHMLEELLREIAGRGSPLALDLLCDLGRSL